MPEKKPMYANFPERGFKVLIGAHINATNTKLLRKLTIGTYEMSVNQQEKIGATVDNARVALSDMARERGLVFETVEHRDSAGAYKAGNEDVRYEIWVGTPFESGQTTHLLWIRFTAPSEARRMGIAFKLATSYSIEEIMALFKKAEEAAHDLEPEAPYEISGNPPPRFKKKADLVAEAAAAAAAAEANGDMPPSDGTAEAAAPAAETAEIKGDPEDGD